MNDTNAALASMAERVARGEVSQGVDCGARRAVCSSASEFKARKLFYNAIAALKNNTLDAADLSDAFRDRLLAFYRDIDSFAPPASDWDKAMGMTP